MDDSTQYALGYEKGREDGRNITAEIEARYAESCEKYKAEIAELVKKQQELEDQLRAYRADYVQLRTIKETIRVLTGREFLF